MSLLKQQTYFLVLFGTLNLCFVTKIRCGLQPYYIHFPPPFIPIPNGLEPVDFRYNPWPIRNSTLSRNLPGSIPLVVHTWVKPGTSEAVKLHNGTIIYYVAPPWGGIRSSSPTSASPQATTTLSNSLSEHEDYSTLSPGGMGIERQGLFEAPNRQVGGYANSVSAGLQPPTSTIDITTPPPNRDGSPWGHGHNGFGWTTATQFYDKLPETTTGTNPTRSQIGNNSTPPTTTTVNTVNQTPPTRASTTERTTTSGTTPTTTTADPVAANTNARFPVSDSVRKFRRIVAQIRAITRKELGTTTRRSRTLRTRS